MCVAFDIATTPAGCVAYAATDKPAYKGGSVPVPLPIEYWSVWDGSLDGAEAVFETGSTSMIEACLLSENKVLVVYQDTGNSSYGTACVGNINPATEAIIWETPVVFKTAATTALSLALLTPTQVIVGYSATNTYSVILNITGNLITAGDELQISSGSTSYSGMVTLTPTKALFIYSNNNVSRGESVILTVDSSAITSYSIRSFNGSGGIKSASSSRVEFISSTAVLAVYSDAANSSYGTAQIFTISDTTITIHAEHVFNAGNCTQTLLSLLADNRYVIGYQDQANSGQSTLQILTVDTVNNTVSSGTKAAMMTTAGYSDHEAFAVIDSNVVITFYESSTGSLKGLGKVATIDGTDITLLNSVTVNPADAKHPAAVKLDNKRVFIAYQDVGNSNRGTGKVLKAA